MQRKWWHFLSLKKAEPFVEVMGVSPDGVERLVGPIKLRWRTRNGVATEDDLNPDKVHKIIFARSIKSLSIKGPPIGLLDDYYFQHSNACDWTIQDGGLFHFTQLSALGKPLRELYWQFGLVSEGIEYRANHLCILGLTGGSDSRLISQGMTADAVRERYRSTPHEKNN